MTLIDHRENNDFKDICKMFLDDVKIVHLEVGDIERKGVIFEHKTPNDFVGSIFDGRLFRQIEEMRDNYDYFYIIVSGSYEDTVYKVNDKYENIVGAISSCFVRKCPVIFVDDYINVCEIIKKISDKLSDGKIRIKPVSKSSIEDIRIRIICSIPGVSRKKGEALLAYFGRIDRILTADVKELKQVKGIGDVIAKTITRLSD